MYLLDYDINGKITAITVVPDGTSGAVASIPVSIETMLANGTIEQLETNKYKIKGVN